VITQHESPLDPGHRLRSRRPIGSVLIPAHNEGAVIGRAYIALGGGSARWKRDESSLTVTANARDARTDS
jgi:hypothetical protein